MPPAPAKAWRLGGLESWKLYGSGSPGLGASVGSLAWCLGGFEARCLQGLEVFRASKWSWEALGNTLGAFGCFLGALEVSCCFLGWPWSGLSRLASMSSALLGALGVEMLQNVAVAKEWAVFLQKCCCGLRSGGVPLQFLSHRPPRSQFAYKTYAF